MISERYEFTHRYEAKGEELHPPCRVPCHEHREVGEERPAQGGWESHRDAAGDGQPAGVKKDSREHAQSNAKMLRAQGNSHEPGAAYAKNVGVGLRTYSSRQCREGPAVGPAERQKRNDARRERLADGGAGLPATATTISRTAPAALAFSSAGARPCHSRHVGSLFPLSCSLCVTCLACRSSAKATAAWKHSRACMTRARFFRASPSSTSWN